MDPYLEQFEQWLVPVLIFLGFLLLRKIFTKYIFKLILRMAKKVNSDILTHVFTAFESPLRSLFVILGIYISMQYVPALNPYEETIMKFIRSGYVILIAWGLYNLSSASSLFFWELNERFKIKIDQILVPFLSKTLRFIIIAITISIIAQEFNYDVNGFVAGLGLGGLAFALAAKDALSNLFGGIVIITEKPFSINDWIKTPSVEGTVEDITFRSTKIRTFAQAVVTVPNATLANEPIMNWSMMGKRQITFNLGVTYHTSKDQMQRVVSEIEAMLKAHDGVHPETIFVKFDTYNDSSLDIFLYFFTNTTAWEEFLNVKQDINFRIMEILEQEGVQVAFPSRTLYVEKQEGNDTMFMND
ncbi:mechanosensitive ion channel family protein [Bacillus tianshenii]|nr:mechanosensitive ion channel family protein [Bacillus tianshenii]